MAGTIQNESFAEFASLLKLATFLGNGATVEAEDALKDAANNFREAMEPLVNAPVTPELKERVVEITKPLFSAMLDRVAASGGINIDGTLMVKRDGNSLEINIPFSP